MSERFYVPDAVEVGPMSLSGPEAHHLSHVIRLQTGDEVTLFNGDGADYPARIENIKKSLVQLNVLQKRHVDRERARAVTIACPLPKGDRAAFLIEKLTELGVRRYVPLQTTRSVVHPGEGKLEKLSRYVIEASKQCGRNVLMSIEPVSDWEALALQADLPAMKALADVTGTQLISALPTSRECIIALGPEGGWTAEEIALGTGHGWQLVTLGPSILRIETAAIAAAVAAFG